MKMFVSFLFLFHPIFRVSWFSLENAYMVYDMIWSCFSFLCLCVYVCLRVVVVEVEEKDIIGKGKQFGFLLKFRKFHFWLPFLSSVLS